MCLNMMDLSLIALHLFNQNGHLSANP
jgi:hypothetical protein